MAGRLLTGQTASELWAGLEVLHRLGVTPEEWAQLRAEDNTYARHVVRAGFHVKLEPESPSEVAAATSRPVQRVRIVSRMTIDVNLGAPLILPFEGAIPLATPGDNWVQVERYMGSLFVGGRKVVRWLSEEQKVGSVSGRYLQKQVKNLDHVHPNVLDALASYPRLIPEELKRNSQGRTLYNFSWAVLFKSVDAVDHYIRCFCFVKDRQTMSYRNILIGGWDIVSPALVLAN